MTDILKLNRRALVRFNGDEAGDFLNDLITADTSRVKAGRIQPGMLLTPQGRILYDLLISRDEDDFILEVDAERRADFIKKMMMYRLRRPVQIRPDDRDVYVLIDGDKGHADPRFDASITRFYGTLEHESEENPTGDDQDYQRLRYQYGVAEGAIDLPPEKALPLEARLDLDQGISFEKGCYIGQEVTARTRYRGLVKRSYLPVRLDRAVACPADITCQDRNAGQLLGISLDKDGLIGLASLRLEMINAVRDEQASLMIDDAAITPIFHDRLMPLPAKKD